MRRAMILAAGRGERMGELTASVPKPLLRVNGRYLIEYAIASIKQAGINEIVINLSWHGDQIQAALGNGSEYGVNIFYSEEPERLETGGGILKALPLLGSEPFIVMSSDIVTDYPLEKLPKTLSGLAHIVMVDNPLYHIHGDYGLQNEKVMLQANKTFTHANIGVYSPDLFRGCTPGHFRLTQVLNPAIVADQVTGEHYQGHWRNIGTKADIVAGDSA